MALRNVRLILSVCHGYNTEAVITEAICVATAGPYSPFGALHSALDDLEVGWYVFRKNTVFIGNMWAANQDPTTWDDPEEFRPQRFLINAGNLRVKVNPK